MEDLPLQAAVRVEVIGLRETPSDVEKFPAVGFKLEGTRIVPGDQPGTLAGTELNPAEYAAWVKSLQAQKAWLYMGPGFTIWPDKTALHKTGEEKLYDANYSFRKDGARLMREQLPLGAELSVRPRLLESRSEIVLHVNAKLAYAQFTPWQIAPDNRKKKIKPLVVQQPEVRELALTCAAPVSNASTVILAHWIRQTADETGRVREHIFWMATATRVGKPIDAVGESSPAPLPEAHAVTLQWTGWDKPEGSEPASASAAEPPAGVASDAWTYGIICGDETPATWEWTERRSIVAGIAGSEPRYFDIKKFSGGARGEAALTRSDAGVRLQLKASLSDPSQVLAARSTIDSPRMDGKEEFAYQSVQQRLATVETAIAAGAQPLESTWRTEDIGPGPFPLRAHSATANLAKLFRQNERANP